MIYKINKQLILEDYMQDMMDGMEHDDAVSKHGERVEHHVQDEKILDKYKTPTKPFTQGDILKPKYDEFNKNSLNIIRDQSSRFNLPYEKSVDNSHRFMKTLGNIENSGNTTGGNNYTSAKGLYQHTNDNVQTAVNRTSRILDKHADGNEWMKDAKVHKDANLLSRAQQTNMTMGNIAGHPYSGTSKSIYSGDTTGQKDVYNRIHHTNPDKLTAMVRDREFNKG